MTTPVSLLASTEHRRRATLRRLVAAAVAAGVLAVTAVVVVGLLAGDGAPTRSEEGPGAAVSRPTGEPTIEPGLVPGIWEVPPVSAGPLILPSPAGSTGGVPTGFPHTTQGAISAAARYAETVIGLDEDRAQAVGEVAAAPSYVSAADDFAAGVRELRQNLGLTPGRPAGGAYVMFRAEAYRVSAASPDRVLVQLLGIVEGAGPATSGQSRTATLLPDYTLVWADDDWRIAGDTGLAEPDPLPAPRSPQAYQGGWRDLAMA